MKAKFLIPVFFIPVLACGDGPAAPEVLQDQSPLSFVAQDPVCADAGCPDHVVEVIATQVGSTVELYVTITPPLSAQASGLVEWGTSNSSTFSVIDDVTVVLPGDADPLTVTVPIGGASAVTIGVDD